MLIGRAERKVRKHTSGVEVVNLTTWIESVVAKYWLNAQEWERWSHAELTVERAFELFEY